MPRPKRQKPDLVYRVRHRETGEWFGNGRIFRQIGHAKNALPGAPNDPWHFSRVEIKAFELIPYDPLRTVEPEQPTFEETS